MKKLLMAIGILALSLPVTLAAQNVAVDEGVFRVTLNGEIVGREEFSVRRVGLGTEARLILRATVELDMPEGRQLMVPGIMATGLRMSVMDYEMKKTGVETSETYVRRADRRFLARIISPRGEEVREYRAGPGSIILDRFVAHQHHLLLPYLEDPASVSLTVLFPETGVQSRMTFSFVGDEEVRVGTNLVQGRHFRLEGGEASRDLWFDAQSRILRVEIADLGYTAERESLG
jgi:hypothetical protein